MPFYLFLWDHETLEHLAEHGVTPDEFQQVVCGAECVTKSKSTNRPVTIGCTLAGRLLVCVYEFVDRETILPITAFEPSEE